VFSYQNIQKRRYRALIFRTDMKRGILRPGERTPGKQRGVGGIY
jgi:hypothetical protein